MMSWGSDVFTFRCNNELAFAYRISTDELITFDINEVDNIAPAVAPSGNRFYHNNQVYDNTGNSILDLNESNLEHSCIGKLANGNDAHFAVAFAQGPMGGCIGDIIAHDLTTGFCFPVISQSQGYDYPQSGVHISALAHKNTEGGWLAASMIGYDQNGQSLLDQELVIARADEGNITVCRIGHHRSDEDQYDYWGEPHAVISPTGTRVLFGSDWSGSQDGQSVDSYVVELPAFFNTISTNDIKVDQEWYKIFPNPVNENSVIEFNNPTGKEMTVSLYHSNGQQVSSAKINTSQYNLNIDGLNSGLYFFRITDFNSFNVGGSFKIIKE